MCGLDTASPNLFVQLIGSAPSARQIYTTSGASDSRASGSGSGSDSEDRRRRRSGSAKRGGVTEEQILDYMSKKAQKKAEKVAKKMKANAVSVLFARTRKY
ncbi:hypothetical protein VPH35_093215 [Triticum aestivum]